MNNRHRTNERVMISRRFVLAGLGIGLTFLAAGVLIPVGCKKAKQPPASARWSGGEGENSVQRSEQVFKIAIDTLFRLPQFDSMEMLQQVVNRLDQWVRKQKPRSDWKADPFTAKLFEDLSASAEQTKKVASGLAKLKEPEQLEDLRSQLRVVGDDLEGLAEQCEGLAKLTYLREFAELAGQTRYLAEQIKAFLDQADSQEAGKLADQVRSFFGRINLKDFERVAVQMEESAKLMDVAKLEFSEPDGFALREAVWLRDVSRWAGGEEQDDPLKPAKRLFDWVVRNIQLEPDRSALRPGTAGRIFRKPWETLLFGRGTATDRAWVFVLLARQQRLDAALLAIADSDDAAQERVRPWVVAVLVRDELYLFDPALGLPIPAPNGVKLEDGQLDIQPATLSEVAADDALLRQLDVDAKARYPVQSAQVDGVVALLETSPSYLAERMKLVESRLTGEQKLVLTTTPEIQAERFQDCRHVRRTRPWRLPYQVVFQDILLGAEGLQWQLLELMPFIGTGRAPVLWKGRVYHLHGTFTGDLSATSYYQVARLPESQLGSAKMDPQLEMVLRQAKANASYWLGLIAAERGDVRSAVDYLQTRTLLAVPGGPWTSGAIYNLARVYEADQRFSEAIELYRADSSSPGYHGNLLRARWLESLTESKGQSQPPGEPAEKPEGT